MIDVKDYIDGDKFENLILGMKDDNYIFSENHLINDLFKKSSIDYPFVLITHNTDGNITKYPTRLIDADFNLMSNNLIKWFGQNVDVVDNRVESIPIGLERDRWFPNINKKHKIFNKNLENKKHKNLLYINHNTGTFPKERIEPYNIFRKHKLIKNNKPTDEYCEMVFRQREWLLKYGTTEARAISILKTMLNKIKDKFNSKINYTNGFAHGFKLGDYYNYLQNSKIAIVPNGAVIPESFRYFEAFESNCIVITTYPKHLEQYNHWYYENSPAIFLKDWNQLNEGLIKELLTESKLKEYEIKNKEYFDKNISTKSISNYMLNIIKNKE